MIFVFWVKYVGEVGVVGKYWGFFVVSIFYFDVDFLGKVWFCVVVGRGSVDIGCGGEDGVDGFNGLMGFVEVFVCRLVFSSVLVFGFFEVVVWVYGFELRVVMRFGYYIWYDNFGIFINVKVGYGWVLGWCWFR